MVSVGTASNRGMKKTMASPHLLPESSPWFFQAHPPAFYFPPILACPERSRPPVIETFPRVAAWLGRRHPTRTESSERFSETREKPAFVWDSEFFTPRLKRCRSASSPVTRRLESPTRAPRRRSLRLPSSPPRTVRITASPFR